MTSAVEFVSFNLKKGASVPDFLLASDKMNSEFLSVQNVDFHDFFIGKGYQCGRGEAL